MAKCKEIDFLFVYYDYEIDKIKVQNTELLRRALNEYLRSDIDDIYDAYVKPSTQKVKAWNFIKKQYERNNMIMDAKVINHNSRAFSMGAIIEKEGRKYFIYDTKDKRRCLDCTDLL